MRTSLLKYCRIAALSVMIAVASIAAAADKNTPEFDPFTASIEENITTPAVNSKYSQAVVAAMGQLANTFKNAGYSVDKVRNGEVVMVTIACDKLFAPNQVKLKNASAKQLLPLLPYLKRNDKYKVVLAVHADNTGDSAYADNITADRAAALDEYFSAETGLGDDLGLIPYGLGADEPVKPNAGIKNRAANRRVEIYFIPTAEYIDKIRSRK